MRSKLIFLGFFLTLLCNIAQSASTGLSQEEQVEEWLSEVQEKVLEYSESLKEQFFTPVDPLDLVERSDQMAKFQELYQVHVEPLYQKLASTPWQNFTNEDLKRRIRFSLDTSFMVLSESDAGHYGMYSSYFRNLPVRICQKDKKDGCQKIVGNDGEYIVTSTNEIDKMQYLWQKWREGSKNTRKQNLQRMIAIYAKMAKGNNYEPPSKYWYRFYDDDNLLSQIIDVARELRPIYMQLQAYIRHSLKENYGDAFVSENNLIPHHLYEKVFLENWSKDIPVASPFPDHPLPDIDAPLQAKFDDARNLVEQADKFFTSIGLEDLSDDIWENNIKQYAEESDDDVCIAKTHPLIYVQALQYCSTITSDDFFEVVMKIAHLRYGGALKVLPEGFNGQANPGFADAIGRAVFLSIVSPKYLIEHEIVSEVSDELEINRLFHVAIDTFLPLATAYAHERILVQLLDGKLEMPTFNCEYWDMFSKFTGTGPPIERKNAHMDPSAQFYEGLPFVSKDNTIKIMSEVLSYQIYNGLCKFQHGDEQLAKCDFSGVEEAGAALKTLMEAGSSKPWQKLIEPLTGYDKLSAQPIIKYFEPLTNWLTEENKKNNVEIGWQATEKCEK